MTFRPSLLKPGLLVSLNSSLKGGISYSRVDLQRETLTEDGAVRAQWETTKTITNAKEYDRATKARSAARAAVVKVCTHSAFGLLCPQDREPELAAAIEEARSIASAHNQDEQNQLTRVQVFVLVGRIAQSDEEAARAIGSEVRGLVAAMEAGIKSADPEAIREAASKARALEGMLSADVANRVSAAVEEARGAAKEIARRVAKGGEAAAKVVSELSMKRLEAARFAVLDIVPDVDDVAPIAIPGRAVDMDEAPAIEKSAAPQAAFELEV